MLFNYKIYITWFQERVFEMIVGNDDNDDDDNDNDDDGNEVDGVVWGCVGGCVGVDRGFGNGRSGAILGIWKLDMQEKCKGEWRKS